MTLQPTPASNGRISPVLIRSLGCIGSASLLSSGLLLNGLALAQETLDSALLDESAPIAAIESAPAYVAPEPAYVEPEPAYVAPEPAYVAPEPAYVAPEPVYVAPVEPVVLYEPEPVYEAPLPAPALESPVVQLSPEELTPPASYQDYAEETQVETVFDEPLQDYAPRLDVVPSEAAGGSFIDNSDLYSTGATDSEVIYAEDAELLENPEVIVSEPAVNGTETIEEVAPSIAAPAQSIAGEPANVDAPLTAEAAESSVPTNVTAAQAEKIQPAAAPNVIGSSRNNNLPSPSTAATTQVAGHASQSSGYSVTYPTASKNPLSVAVHSLGQNFSSSLNVSSYFARTQRPNGVIGNGDRQLLFPLSMPAPISSVFGWRTHPIFGNRRFHSGTDLAAEQGTPIVATLSGQASTADFVGGYGLTVVLDHADGKHQTLYGHMSEIYVQPGQIVQQGEVIGRVGSTGNSTGPHLHFEIRELTNEGWVAIDPGRFLEGSIAQLMQLLRSEPMQPISIAQIPIKLSPGQLASANPQKPIKLSTGLQPLLQKQQPQQLAQGFKPTTPLEQKVVEVVKALEGSPVARTQATAPSNTTQFTASPVSYQQSGLTKLVTQAIEHDHDHNH